MDANILIKIANREKLSGSEIENLFYIICHSLHGINCYSCPVYIVNGEKVPGKIDCEVIKDGKAIVQFIRNKTKEN